MSKNRGIALQMAGQALTSAGKFEMVDNEKDGKDAAGKAGAETGGVMAGLKSAGGKALDVHSFLNANKPMIMSQLEIIGQLNPQSSIRALDA